MPPERLLDLIDSWDACDNCATLEGKTMLGAQYIRCNHEVSDDEAIPGFDFSATRFHSSLDLDDSPGSVI